MKGFQLWVALPPELENAANASQYVMPEEVPVEGPVRVILGAYRKARSPIAAPMDPSKRVIHAGDISEVGKAVAAAFSARGRLPNGSVLSVCGGVYSWKDFASTLRALGHNLEVVRVPAEAYDRFFPGAPEVREMFQYFEEQTYFGPRREAHIAAAKALVPGGFTTFAHWARTHMNLIADASASTSTENRLRPGTTA